MLLEALELGGGHADTSASSGADGTGAGSDASNGDRPIGSGSPIGRGAAISVFPVTAS